MVSDGEVWKYMARETNTYAEQEQARDPPHAPEWTPVDTATLKAFIGLVFCFAWVLLNYPHTHENWRQRNLYLDRHSIISCQRTDFY